MARVMIVGYGPLPQTGQSFMAAPALRTRNLVKAITEAGHTVNLYLLPMPGTEGPGLEVAAMMTDRYEGLAYQRFANHDGGFAIRTLTAQARQYKPDAIVGVNTYAAYVASMMKTVIPVWADLNGLWMAELAGRCWSEGDDAHLEGAWCVERAIVRRCDKFSAVSRPQLHAVIGEMASVGRLNKYTFNYPFGCVIPNAAYRWPAPPAPAPEAAPPADPNDENWPVLRGPIVPKDAFIMLWSGGFNVWSDIDMMMTAMEKIMDKHPLAHFVATGGRIEGVADAPFERFLELRDASQHKGRFHALGWVDSVKLPRIYRESDIGLNVDGANYETMFGARNRLNAMAAEGLALVSTLGCEISEWLDDGQALLGVPLGDAEALAEKIESVIGKTERLKDLGDRARRIMDEDFSIEKTSQKLLAWLENPQLAPDNKEKLARASGEVEDLNAVWLNPLEHQAIMAEAYTAEQIHKGMVDLTAIRGKLWYRVGKKLKP